MGAGARTLEEILLWTARDSGPLIHFWFGHDGGYQRICDGTPWPGDIYQPDKLDGPSLPCRVCKEMYVEDVVYGGKVLTIAASDFTPSEPCYNGVEPCYNGVEPCYNGVEPSQKEYFMPRVSLSQFANFYEARPSSQVKVVRQVREQLASPEMFRRHNFYGYFHDQLRKTHLLSGDIRDFEERLPAFVSNLNDRRKHQPYLELGNAYVDFLNHRGGTLFVPEPVVVHINGLEVRVRPEVGIRDGEDVQVLQLWFKKAKPGRYAKQVIVHFMEQARSQSSDWMYSWSVGIWDIRRREVPPPVRTAHDFVLGLEGQVASFLRIWTMLEDTGQ